MNKKTYELIGKFNTHEYNEKAFALLSDEDKATVLKGREIEEQRRRTEYERRGAEAELEFNDYLNEKSNIHFEDCAKIALSFSGAKKIEMLEKVYKKAMRYENLSILATVAEKLEKKLPKKFQEVYCKERLEYLDGPAGFGNAGFDEYRYFNEANGVAKSFSVLLDEPKRSEELKSILYRFIGRGSLDNAKHVAELLEAQLTIDQLKEMIKNERLHWRSDIAILLPEPERTEALRNIFEEQFKKEGEEYRFGRACDTAKFLAEPERTDKIRLAIEKQIIAKDSRCFEMPYFIRQLPENERLKKRIEVFNLYIESNKLDDATEMVDVFDEPLRSQQLERILSLQVPEVVEKLGYPDAFKTIKLLLNIADS